MLNILRKNKENFIIKFVLLLIILSFALFFGTSSLRSGASSTGSAAMVNGEPINTTKANFLMRSQIDELNKSGNTELPDSIINMIQSSIINQLVNRKLIDQALAKYGLEVSKKELSEQITTNPQFVKDGKFDKNFYVKRFLPYYSYQRGSSFENDFRNELTSQKLFDAFNNLLTANNDELAQWHKIQNTKYTFEVIRVSEEEKANDLFAQWKANEEIAEILKKEKLTKQTTPDISYTQFNTIFGGKTELDHIKTLLALTEKDPFPQTYLKSGNHYYLIKLTKHTSVTSKIDDETLTELQESYQDSLKMSLETSFIRDLRDHAKIKIAPQFVSN